tara:strand:+ start:645 stop:1862 length:1218 start_codon:yes stop_codon:yes gene_type:complete
MARKRQARPHGRFSRLSKASGRFVKPQGRYRGWKSHSDVKQKYEKLGEKARRAALTQASHKWANVFKDGPNVGPMTIYMQWPNSDAPLLPTMAQQVKIVRNIATHKKWGPHLRNRLAAMASIRVAMNFQEAEDASGASWPPLSPSTLKKRQKRGAQARGTKLPKRRKKGETVADFDKRRQKILQAPSADLEISRTGKRRRVEQGGNVRGLTELTLIDSGDLFGSVVGNMSEVAPSTEKRPTGYSQKLQLKVSGKGKIVIQPIGLRKMEKVKFKVHNKPVGDKTVVGPKKQKNRPVVPGREFFYLKAEDYRFFEKVFTAWIIAGGKLTKPGKKKTTMATLKTRRAARTKAAESLLIEDIPGRDVSSLFDLIGIENQLRLEREGVQAFLNATKSIRQSVAQRRARMR